MQVAYLVCLIVGIIIPLISLCVSVFDGFLVIDGLDFFEVDLGGLEIDFLPISANSLSMASLIFGGVGWMLYSGMDLWKANTIAGIAAYISAVLLQTGIGYLKKSKNLAEEENQLLNREAVVTNTILKDGFGNVSLTKKDASVVTLPAKSEDGSELKQGTKVYSVRMENTYLIVRAQEVKKDGV